MTFFLMFFEFLGDFLGPKMAEKSNKKREFRRPFFVWFLKLVLFRFLSILGPKTTAKSKKKGPEIESGHFVKKCVLCRQNNDFQGSGVSKDDQNWRKSEGENERGKKTANVRKTVDFGAPKRARNRKNRVRKPTKKSLEKKELKKTNSRTKTRTGAAGRRHVCGQAGGGGLKTPGFLREFCKIVQHAAVPSLRSGRRIYWLRPMPPTPVEGLATWGGSEYCKQ